MGGCCLGPGREQQELLTLESLQPTRFIVSPTKLAQRLKVFLHLAVVVSLGVFGQNAVCVLGEWINPSVNLLRANCGPGLLSPIRPSRGGNFSASGTSRQLDAEKSIISSRPSGSA